MNAWVATLDSQLHDPAKKLGSALILTGHWVARLMQERGEEAARQSLPTDVLAQLTHQLEKAEPHIDLATLGQALQCELRVLWEVKSQCSGSHLGAGDFFEVYPATGCQFTRPLHTSTPKPCFSRSPKPQNPKPLTP